MQGGHHHHQLPLPVFKTPPKRSTLVRIRITPLLLFFLFFSAGKITSTLFWYTIKEELWKFQHICMVVRISAHLLISLRDYGFKSISRPVRISQQLQKSVIWRKKVVSMVHPTTNIEIYENVHHLIRHKNFMMTLNSLVFKLHIIVIWD